MLGMEGIEGMSLPRVVPTEALLVVFVIGF
jgi:hypothetical protein